MPYSEEQLSSALVAADRAGDTDAARRLAAEITKMRQGASVSRETPVVAEQPAAPDYDLMPWSEVGKRAIENTPESAVQFAKDLTALFREPVQTAKAVGNLAMGIASKAIPGKQESEKYADAVGKFFVERYGGLPELKRTLATDPVGFASDASAVLSAGGTLAAKAPGYAGKIGRAVGAAGRAIDPAAMAVRGITATGRGAGSLAAAGLGVMTGTGPAPIKEAVKSGIRGGAQGKAFRAALRGGDASMVDVVGDAKAALGKMRQQRAAAYRSGMVDISKDATVIDFGDIEKAFNKAVADNTFKGVAKSKGAAKAFDEIRAEIDHWKGLDPRDFHTPEGIDAFKQRIGDLMDWKGKTDKENRAIQSVYNDVRGIIEKQAPTYSKTMRDYGNASRHIDEIEKALSLNDRASADTALRKLTSIMRNNINTNYGKRAKLAEDLQAASGAPIIPSVAGLSMSSIAPRGLQNLGTHMAVTGLAGGLLTPWALGTLPAQSPRIVGEAAHAAGRAIPKMTPEVARAINDFLMSQAGVSGGHALFQAGRAQGLLSQQ